MDVVLKLGEIPIASYEVVVSILVLMDVVLKHGAVFPTTRGTLVSILVLMDVVLKRYGAGNSALHGKLFQSLF